jgi:hypothetical protein
VSVNQVSVFLENKPGTLNRLTEVLAVHNINIRALSLAETSEFGIVRMLVNDVFEATNVLKENNFVATLEPVFAYAVEYKAGDLNSLLNKFTEIGVNIEYMYAFAGKERSYMIFCVSDTKKAEALLNDRGLKSLTQEEIYAV